MRTLVAHTQNQQGTREAGVPHTTGVDMPRLPIFVSVVCVVRNTTHGLEAMLTSLGEVLVEAVNDFEIIVVDNASEDESLQTLQRLTSEDGLPNIQVYALTKKVSRDAACWMGLENALGDFVAVLDPRTDDVSVIPQMLRKCVSGTDVVFAHNLTPPKGSSGYQFARSAFEVIYRCFTGVRLSREAPAFRVMSRRVVNYVQQHPQPAISYRLLPATGGFIKTYLTYTGTAVVREKASIWDGMDRGMQILVSSSRAPLRAVTMLSLFGAISNVLYAFYVLAIGFFKKNVEPGWISVSLQQSGMFFLLSLVLLVLGEYILHMAALSNEAPGYNLGREFTSAMIINRDRLNVEVVAEPTRGHDGRVH